MRLIALTMLLTLTSLANGQVLGSHYFWANKVYVTSTPVDSTFKQPWEYCSVYADTIDVYIKVGAPDTSKWNSREWIYLSKGSSIEFSPFVRLRRLAVKAATGTGNVYIIGFKKKPQY